MASTGMRRPVWNCTALTATRRTPRDSSASSFARPSSVRKSSTSRKTSSSPKVSAARCQGVTFVGNSPRRQITRSPARHGKHIATFTTLWVVLGTSATSSG